MSALRVLNITSSSMYFLFYSFNSSFSGRNPSLGWLGASLLFLEILLSNLSFYLVIRMPPPGANCLTRLFGLGDLNKIEREDNQRRLRRRLFNQLPFDERMAWISSNRGAMPLQHPRVFQGARNPGIFSPRPGNIYPGQAFEMWYPDGSYLPDYLEVLHKTFCPHSRSSKINDANWERSLLEQLFKFHLHEINAVRLKYHRARYLDIQTLSPDSMRKWLMILFQEWEEMSHYDQMHSPYHGHRGSPHHSNTRTHLKSGGRMGGFHAGVPPLHRHRHSPFYSSGSGSDSYHDPDSYDISDYDYYDDSDHHHGFPALRPMHRAASEGDIHGHGFHRRPGPRRGGHFTDL